MNVTPNKEDIITLAKKLNKPILVPLSFQQRNEMDPALTYFQVRKKFDNSFLLESVRGPANRTRYSIIGYDPILHVRRDKEGWTIEGEGESTDRSRDRIKQCNTDSDPLSKLKKCTFMDCTEVMGSDLPRYILGIFGYLSYDYVKHLEDIQSKTENDLGHPLLEFMLPSSIILFDKHYETACYSALMLIHDIECLNEHYTEAIRRLKRMKKLKEFKSKKSTKKIKKKSNISFTDYKNKVEEIIGYIEAGDVIQTVLSRRIDLEPVPELESFYSNLRNINPSPYMFFLDFNAWSVIGSSPEALVRVEGETVMTMPIAGTRRRGKDATEDGELEKELLDDEKERAEHVMLVDLGRNDIGKVSKYGSVFTDRFMKVEKYGDVQHLVSKVSGQLTENKDAFDALKAVFPAGTVTGAPKVRAMEIIEELEPTRRGIYSGAVGSFSYTGDSDFAISIRTLTSSEDKAHIQVGGGVVADSKPEEEFSETKNKARSLLRAAGVET
ncbi:MAG: anthranilate synthase component I family protein [Candidatus Hadarchaeia archaeon]